MRRRWFLIVGLFLLVGTGALLVASGVPPLVDPSAATLLLLPLAGVLFALGGSDRRVGGIEWYQFVGAGQIVVGSSFALMILLPIVTGTSAYEPAVQPFIAVAAAGGAVSIVFIGVDWIRGGHHFDVSMYEPGPILTSR